MPKELYDPMDMKALLCFETMAKHGSLTQASIELGISDAAVSQRIKSLERYLGTKLYEARGVKPTCLLTGPTSSDERVATPNRRSMAHSSQCQNRTPSSTGFRTLVTTQ